MGCRIKTIEYYLPAKIVTNQDLLKENPSWDIEAIVKKTGVFSRHIAKDNETALDLAYEACNKLFKNSNIDADKLGAVIFCTQSPDHILPSNAYIIHQKLNLPDDCFAFDINLACSGFIYGLAIAQSFLITNKLENILLITSDTYSKYIHAKDKSVRLLFGDGAAASLIQKSKNGIVGIKLGAYGKGYNKFIIPAGGCRVLRNKDTCKETEDNSGNIRTHEHIFMEGFSLLTMAIAKVPQNIKQLLNENNLTLNDIKLFIFHQASQTILDTLTASLGIPKSKVFNNISKVGNTVSASIPIAIKDALDQQKISKGDKVLLSGFGAGFSWGSAILEWD